ncbi:MAG: transcription initiation factor TFIIIB [Clostridia bacterium]|nr:transcription initiation factor TFIIIB [Clostridia bacterium]
MENKCPFCGNEKIINGKLESTGGLVFLPNDQKGLVKKSSYISALACEKCGAVFGMKLTDKPCKLTN